MNYLNAYTKIDLTLMKILDEREFGYLNSALDIIRRAKASGNYDLSSEIIESTMIRISETLKLVKHKMACNVLKYDDDLNTEKQSLRNNPVSLNTTMADIIMNHNDDMNLFVTVIQALQLECEDFNARMIDYANNKTNTLNVNNKVEISV